MNKAVVFTANNMSRSLSYLIAVFGSPLDYISVDFPEFSFVERRVSYTNYDRVHSVALDVQNSKVYYGNNVHGRVEYADSLNTISLRKYYYYHSAPVTRQVISLVLHHGNILRCDAQVTLS